MRRSAVSLNQALGLIFLIICLIITTRRVYEQQYFSSLLSSIQQQDEAKEVLLSPTRTDGVSTSSELTSSQVVSQSAPVKALESPPTTQTPQLETATSNTISSTQVIAESKSDALYTQTSFSDATTSTAAVDSMPTEEASSAHGPVNGCPEKTGDEGLFAQATPYVQAIMNSSTNSSMYDMPRLECPTINVERYSHLALGAVAPGKPRYFFAINLFQSVAIMPQLLASTVEVMRFLGPELCALSIVEGRSTDGTFEILKMLAQEMEALGVRYFLSCNERNPWGGETDRISALSELRNQALAPLTHHPGRYDIATTIIFLNDIAPCSEDILELIHQRTVLEADMTCAMDWINDGVSFYDIWISRQMNGEMFFEIPQSGSWEFSKNLFWNHFESRSRYKQGKPVQVFSCWNGAVALNAQPFMEGKVDFRSAHIGECYFGEPTLLAKDLWKLGNGRIAIIPKVNLGYSVEVSAKAKELHGWVSKQPGKKGTDDTGPTEWHGLKWQEKPPASIHCASIGTNPTWERGYWVPWDQTLRRR
ncbi:cryptococcal mannosyltransferase 1-domain-containing protein [Exophiala viscosa]|uniref:Cryptococcal mannosyltransferase 1-domain-containing protein n=1 Tax=Exophiala viscosa TaxID=2486360 RepID=A0AAN6ICM0_9EURO|nr:cryptococcal mannosyltransferase 1-domain-containing protein [Exophiala viscosa]